MIADIRYLHASQLGQSFEEGLQEEEMPWQKLDYHWEDPFVITDSLGKGFFRLKEWRGDKVTVDMISLHVLYTIICHHDSKLQGCDPLHQGCSPSMLQGCPLICQECSLFKEEEENICFSKDAIRRRERQQRLRKTIRKVYVPYTVTSYLPCSYYMKAVTYSILS